jgi:hypothetical protein
MLFFLLMTTEGWCTNVVSKVDRWYWYPKEMDPKSITELEKREIITEMRRRVPLSDSTDQTQYRRLLLRLGDEQTLAEVMADIRSEDQRKRDDGFGAMAYVHNPALIPYLVELLYLPEPARLILLDKEPTQMGHFEPTRPFWAGQRIRDILWRCSEFSPEMKQWIDDLWRLTGDPLRDVLRQWWEQNKEAFARKDYAAVKPLQPVATPAPSAATNQAPPATVPVPTNNVAAPGEEK